MNKDLISVDIIQCKKTYNDDYQMGLCISNAKGINKDGSVIVDKFFLINTKTLELEPFKYKDMFEILYCETIDLEKFL